MSEILASSVNLYWFPLSWEVLFEYMYVNCGHLIVSDFYHCVLSFPNCLPLPVVILKKKKQLLGEQMFIHFNGPVTSEKILMHIFLRVRTFVTIIDILLLFLEPQMEHKCYACCSTSLVKCLLYSAWEDVM